MKKLILWISFVLFASCAQYPDISGLTPREALAALDAYELQLDQIESDARSNSGEGILVGEFAAAAAAANQISIDNVVQNRARLAADRNAIFSQNPSLGTATQTTDSNVNTGPQMSSFPTAVDSCGLSPSIANEASRRNLFARVSGSGIGAYQSDSDLRSFVRTTPVPVGYGSMCEAIQDQVRTLVSVGAQSFNNARQVSGFQNIDMNCSRQNDGSAYGATSCQAAAALYSAASNSAACRIACAEGR